MLWVAVPFYFDKTEVKSYVPHVNMFNFLYPLLMFETGFPSA
jgi:hypothetical protein